MLVVACPLKLLLNLSSCPLNWRYPFVSGAKYKRTLKNRSQLLEENRANVINKIATKHRK